MPDDPTLTEMAKLRAEVERLQTELAAEQAERIKVQKAIQSLFLHWADEPAESPEAVLRPIPGFVNLVPGPDGIPVPAPWAYPNALPPGIVPEPSDQVDEPRPVFVIDPDGSARFRYRNHRGEVAMRRVMFCRDDPPTLYWGSTVHHPRKQWLLEVFDPDRRVVRTFALEGILEPE